jgi:hypothetical protein
MLVNFTIILNILRFCGTIYGRLVQFAVIWYIFPVLICLDQEKSGNPDLEPKTMAAWTFGVVYAERIALSNHGFSFM